MKALLNRIHARVGDLWWYSAMIFLACRSGDVIQAFIGLWLVPKYVGSQELGAVLPLQQLTSFLTVPLAIVAVVFSKYVNTYATRGEYGKVKSFIHDVFTACTILFIVCIVAAYLIMPFFYERLRISSGSLTFLILLCGLVTNLGSIIGSAQQGLKRFKTMSLMTLIGAPIRLVTLLIAMPFRALSGYILGQTTPGATTAFFSFFDIRKSLKPYTPDTTWRKDLPEIWRYLWPVAVLTIFSSFFASVSATIYRQRLPEIESSAYYMLSRFSEFASYAGSTLGVVIFPLASEAHEKGLSTSRYLRPILGGIILPTILIALIFSFSANWLLSLNETWKTYQAFGHLLPILTISSGLGILTNTLSSFELACRRFVGPSILLLTTFVWTAFLVCFTGYGYFQGLLPDATIEWMRNTDLSHLSTLTWYTAFYGIVQVLILLSFRLTKTKRP